MLFYWCVRDTNVISYVFRDKGDFIYNISPLNMAGDYITNSFHWAIVPLYWIILSIICIKIIIIMFMNRFQKEKLLIN